MTPELLINRNDIAEYKDISNSVLDKVLNMHIRDAQFNDIQPFLGVKMYNDLLRNYTDANYQTLLNGGDYTYLGVTYTNVGLKSVIVHYAYARYVLMGANTDTPFGMVVKQNNNSVQTPAQDKKILYKQNQQMGFNHWENVNDFLNRNVDDYPLWDELSCNAREVNFRISKIG